MDYSGGAKAMPAALVLATIERSCCYSYVSEDERSKGGIRAVVDGKEKMWFLDNPRDEIAAAGRKGLRQNFAGGRILNYESPRMAFQFAVAGDEIEVRVLAKEGKRLF